MEKISKDVANAIAKAGYWGGQDDYVKEIVDSERLLMVHDGELVFREVPTYFEVWSWISENTSIAIAVHYYLYDKTYWYCLATKNGHMVYNNHDVFYTPERAIKAAINDIVDKNLLINEKE